MPEPGGGPRRAPVKKKVKPPISKPRTPVAGFSDTVKAVPDPIAVQNKTADSGSVDPDVIAAADVEAVVLPVSQEAQESDEARESHEAHNEASSILADIKSALDLKAEQIREQHESDKALATLAYEFVKKMFSSLEQNIPALDEIHADLAEVDNALEQASKAPAEEAEAILAAAKKLAESTVAKHELHALLPEDSLSGLGGLEKIAEQSEVAVELSESGEIERILGNDPADDRASMSEAAVAVMDDEISLSENDDDMTVQYISEFASPEERGARPDVDADAKTKIFSNAALQSEETIAKKPVSEAEQAAYDAADTTLYPEQPPESFKDAADTGVLLETAVAAEQVDDSGELGEEPKHEAYLKVEKTKETKLSPEVAQQRRDFFQTVNKLLFQKPGSIGQPYYGETLKEMEGSTVTIRGVDLKIDSVVGKGGMGIAFLVTNSETNKQGVLKLMKPQDMSLMHGDTDNELERIIPRANMMESIVLSKLSSEARRDGKDPADLPFSYADKVVQLSHPDNQDFRMIMVEMEYIPPTVNPENERETLSLSQQIERMSMDEVMQTANGMLESVKYLHDRGVQHRDIKFDNFLLTPDGKVKIIDFGMATEPSLITRKRSVFKSPEEYIGKHEFESSAAKRQREKSSKGLLASVKSQLESALRSVTGTSSEVADKDKRYIPSYAVPEMIENTFGTIAYMPGWAFVGQGSEELLNTQSPEELASIMEIQNKKKDLYALGVVFLKMRQQKMENSKIGSEERKKILKFPKLDDETREKLLKSEHVPEQIRTALKENPDMSLEDRHALILNPDLSEDDKKLGTVLGSIGSRLMEQNMGLNWQNGDEQPLNLESSMQSLEAGNIENLAARSSADELEAITKTQSWINLKPLQKAAKAFSL